MDEPKLICWRLMFPVRCSVIDKPVPAVAVGLSSGAAGCGTVPCTTTPAVGGGSYSQLCCRV